MQTKEERKEKARIYYQKNKDKINVYTKIYYQKNREEIKEKRNTPEARAKKKPLDKKWRDKNKANKKIYDFKRNYGITQKEYNEIYLRQGGVCAICGNKEIIKINGKVKSLSIDHNHITGEIRGLLCHYCNVAIGILKEDISIFQKCIEYLKMTKRP